MTPEQRQQFIANVPDADKRRAAETIWQAKEDAWRCYADALNENETEPWEKDDVATLVAKDPDVAARKAAYDAAHAAWLRVEDYADPIAQHEDADDVVRCALTGFLIHDGDVTMKDEETGEHILKAALGLPLCDLTGEFEHLIDGDCAGAERAPEAPSKNEAA